MKPTLIRNERGELGRWINTEMGQAWQPAKKKAKPRWLRKRKAKK